MFFERIEAKGLAHYSYLVGDHGVAFVVDPRRDAEVYLGLAARERLRIAFVLETHRQEDFVLGSAALADATGAAIWHADADLPYRYGRPASDGQSWGAGKLTVSAITTPGHTPGSMTYVLREKGGEPWIAFTGDALFAGDVGRVDLPGLSRLREMAEALHESVFGKILPLGDGVIVCPTHGAGSVCGTMIADRPWTTVGLEKRLNPRLRNREKAAFVADVAKAHDRPPYFGRMEELNLSGPPPFPPPPLPLAPGEFQALMGDAAVVDVRSELAFGSAHVPGALSIWPEGLSKYAGWFVGYDRPLLLVTEGGARDAAVELARIGYDRIAGWLGEGMLGWHTAGLPSESIATLTVQELCKLIDEGTPASSSSTTDAGPMILDVRGVEEIERNGRIARAMDVPLPHLPERVGEVPRDRRVHVFCGSGVRSMLAASFLAREGWSDLAVVLGGLEGWNSVRCPVERRA